MEKLWKSPPLNGCRIRTIKCSTSSIAPQQKALFVFIQLYSHILFDCVLYNSSTAEKESQPDEKHLKTH